MRATSIALMFTLMFIRASAGWSDFFARIAEAPDVMDKNIERMGREAKERYDARIRDYENKLREERDAMIAARDPNDKHLI